MIEIGSAIVSLDLFEEFFMCDLVQCKGACCIEGDSGAPLSDREAMYLEADYAHYADYLPADHRNEIEHQGFSLIDKDGDRVTPLVGNRQCAYSFFDDGEILKCAVEKAWSEGKTNLRKPLSCHLFPVRITVYKHFDAINYQKIAVCQPGRECGKRNKLQLWEFLKDPLIRCYGEEWFSELETAAKKTGRCAHRSLSMPLTPPGYHRDQG